MPTAFKLDGGVSFNISKLDIYGTLNPLNAEYLSMASFKVLAKAISKSQLKTSLRQLHIFAESAELSEVNKVVKFYGLEVDVKANKRWAKCRA